MRTYLYITPIVLVAWLALLPRIPAPAAHAADQSSGADPSSQVGRMEITKTKPSMQQDASPAEAAPTQATWVNEIVHSLAIYKASYPASNFTPYLTKLNLVGDAMRHGDRTAVKVEMSAFFKMLGKRTHGISEVAADELTNFALMVTPIQEYGITVPRSGAAQYGMDTLPSGTAQQ